MFLFLTKGFAGVLGSRLFLLGNISGILCSQPELPALHYQIRPGWAKHGEAMKERTGLYHGLPKLLPLKFCDLCLLD